MSRTSRRTFLKGGATAVATSSGWRNPCGLSVLALPRDEPQSAAELAATIAVGKTSPPISKYMYGMFLEHLGMLTYRSLWSEVLDDRKFYFPVTSAKPEETPRRAFGRPLRKWTPIGGDQFVTMDREHVYVGEHSPRVTLDSTAGRGIEQSGLSLRKGITYTGKVVLAGQGAKVDVSLRWGNGAGDHQTMTTPGLHSSYAPFLLKFTPQADTDEGQLQVVGRGGGFLSVGVISLMPEDNVHGFRHDTTKLLHDLDSGFYRLPGGNYISDYEWRDAIGEPDKRSPTWDYAWNAMQPNDVGIDEFMILCKLLNVEPYITVNAGLGDANSAAALVEYTNGSVHTPMGALRAKNGPHNHMGSSSGT